MITTPSQSWWAVATLFAAVMVAAAVVGRLVPTYRAELRVEEDTRMLALDGLRGLLCFSVLLHHAAITLQFARTHVRNPPEAMLYVHLGKSSVALFFCITGFLFWGRVLRRDGKLPLVEFFRGRAFRVLPLYWFSAIVVALLATPALLAIHPSAGQLVRLAIQLSASGVLAWQEVKTPKGAVDFVPFNSGVQWSLRYEWVFYMALPILGSLLARRTWTIVLLFVIAALALVGNALADPQSPRAIERTLAVGSYYTMFPIGMLAAHAVRRFWLATELRRPRWSIIVLLAAASLLLLSSPQFSPGGHPLTDDPRGWACHVLVLLIFVPIAAGNTLFGLLTLPSLRLMGTVSYSVYLLHGIVLFCCWPLLSKLADASDAKNVSYWVAIAGVGILTLLVACLTYLTIERPFIRIDRRLRPRPARDLAPAIPPTATV